MKDTDQLCCVSILQDVCSASRSKDKVFHFFNSIVSYPVVFILLPCLIFHRYVPYSTRKLFSIGISSVLFGHLIKPPAAWGGLLVLLAIGHSLVTRSRKGNKQ